MVFLSSRAIKLSAQIQQGASGKTGPNHQQSLYTGD